MKKTSKALFFALTLIILTVNTGESEPLIANIVDSTGIIGIDMSIGSEPVPIINSVFQGGPAYRAGIHKGDRIVAIDSKPTYGLGSSQIDTAISDIPGTIVHFTILRNQQIYEIDVTVLPAHQASRFIQQQFEFH